MLTLRTWYQTEDPPKSMWKSVYESCTPIRQYLFMKLSNQDQIVIYKSIQETIPENLS